MRMSFSIARPMLITGRSIGSARTPSSTTMTFMGGGVVCVPAHCTTAGTSPVWKRTARISAVLCQVTAQSPFSPPRTRTPPTLGTTKVCASVHAVQNLPQPRRLRLRQQARSSSKPSRASPVSRRDSSTLLRRSPATTRRCAWMRRPAFPASRPTLRDLPRAAQAVRDLAFWSGTSVRDLGGSITRCCRGSTTVRCAAEEVSASRATDEWYAREASDVVTGGATTQARPRAPGMRSPTGRLGQRIRGDDADAAQAGAEQPRP